MSSASWGFIGILVGAIVGAMASILTTVVTGRNAAHLQRESDLLERKERARVFQRETLLAVQDALQDAMRSMGRSHHEDLMAYRKTGAWGKSLLSEEVDQAFLDANRRMAALVERVQDDSLRVELKEIHDKLNRPLFEKSEKQARTLFNEAVLAANRVMTRLGEVLRNHY